MLVKFRKKSYLKCYWHYIRFLWTKLNRTLSDLVIKAKNGDVCQPMHLTLGQIELILFCLFKKILQILFSGDMQDLGLSKQVFKFKFRSSHQRWSVKKAVLKISQNLQDTLHNWSFPLKIPSVNVTKSAVSCGFGHIYWRST